MTRSVILVVAMLIIAGCNTIQGAGRDIQSAGRAVEDAVD